MGWSDYKCSTQGLGLGFNLCVVPSPVKLECPRICQRWDRVRMECQRIRDCLSKKLLKNKS